MGLQSVANRDKIMSTSKRWFYFILVIVIFLFLHYLGDVLVPFLVAALLAYMTNPLANMFVKLKIPRTFAVVIVFILLTILVMLLLLIFVPLFEKQVGILFSKIPALINWIQNTIIPWFNQTFHLADKVDSSDFSNAVSGHWQQAGSVAKSIVHLISNSGLAFIALATNLLLIPVVLFYLLRDWPNIVGGFQNLLPREIEPTVTSLVKQCNEVLGAFLRGQLMVMIALGILYSLGLALVGVDTALVIGMIAGLVSIVPYLGFIVGILSAGVAAFLQFHDLWHIVGVVLVFIVAQSIEGSILTPTLVGDKVGVHPVIVIFAILAGGKLFGFVGILLAIPVTAVLMVLLKYIKSQYLASGLYS